MERAATACTTRTSAPQSGYTCSRPRQRPRAALVYSSAPQQARLTVMRCSSSGSSSGGGGSTPLAAALLSVVQVLAAVQLVVAAPAAADNGDFRISSQASGQQAAEDQYFETVPQGLSSADSSTSPRLGSLIEGPKGKQIQQCTRKCVPTCIRGGQGAPGLGPMSVRKEIVVFKEGYRSRQYCLSECTQVCALSINGPSQAVAQTAK